MNTRHVALACALVVLIGTTTFLFLDGSATNITVNKVNNNELSGIYSTVYWENANAPITGCTSPCLTVDTSKSYPSSSGSFSLPATDTAYVWSTQFGGTATAIPAGKIPVEIWASGSGTPSTITTDGGCTGTQNSGTSVSCALTTTNGGDTVLAFVEVSCTGTGACTAAPTVTSVTATGLTFASRGTTHGSTSITSYVVEEWAYSGSALAAVTVSAALSGTAVATMIAVGINGVPSSGQFDGSAVTASGSSAAPSASISTSNANDIIIGFVGVADQVSGSSLSPTVGAGFTIIPSAAPTTSNGKTKGSYNTNAGSDGEFQTVSSTQTGLSVAFSLGATHNWFMVADALKASVSGLGSLSLSVYYTDSTGTTSTLVGSASTATLTSSKTEYTVTVTNSAFSIPASGYLEVQVAAPSSGTYTIYWGTGQQTNVQLTLFAKSV